MNLNPEQMQSALLMVGMVVFFVFFVILPQKKRQKKAKELRDSLKKGEEIVSSGGIVGVISEVKEDQVIVEVDRGFKLTFEKSSISGKTGSKK
jgi:preprotein translocase subunit YajC